MIDTEMIVSLWARARWDNQLGKDRPNNFVLFHFGRPGEDYVETTLLLFRCFTMLPLYPLAVPLHFPSCYFALLSICVSFISVWLS